jgi:hypothetical protein
MVGDGIDATATGAREVDAGRTVAPEVRLVVAGSHPESGERQDGQEGNALHGFTAFRRRKFSTSVGSHRSAEVRDWPSL